MSNSPLRGSAAQHISFPRRIFCARVVASCFFVSTASPLHLPALRRVGARNPWRQLQPRPRNEGPAERREAYCLVRRARKARPHVCEAWPVPRNRTPPLGAPPWRCRPRHRSGLRHFRRIRPEGCSRPAIVHGGLRPRAFRPRLRAAVDATPRSALRIVSGDAPHERGWQIVYYIFVT